MEEIRIPPLIPLLLRGNAEGRGDQILLNAIIYYATCLIAGITVEFFADGIDIREHFLFLTWLQYKGEQIPIQVVQYILPPSRQYS